MKMKPYYFINQRDQLNLNQTQLIFFHYKDLMSKILYNHNLNRQHSNHLKLYN